MAQLQTNSNAMVGLRLFTVLVLLGLLYGYHKTDETLLACLAFAVLGVFLALVRLHQKISWKKQLAAALVQLNADEISYLNGTAIPFENGQGFNQTSHAYAYDLDVFGDNSLFQHLNRTATVAGHEKLAALLQSVLPPENIRVNQEAIQELTPKTNWRQALLALARVHPDNKKNYETLKAWAMRESPLLPSWVSIAAFLLPAMFLISILLYILTKDQIYANALGYLFVANLFLLFSQQQRIRQEIAQFDRVHDILKQYGLILQQVESETFQSKRLKTLQAALNVDGISASRQITRLSTLFDRMDSIQNIMAVFLFDGALLYHLHTLRTLLHWKKAYAGHIPQWLDVIGEVEALNSLANFSANNPGFVYPTLNDHFKIAFADLGHPLIKAPKRVCNDVSFDRQRFIVLTGSNMSGKSTFLRTLGVNMVLAGVGAPVCATRAAVHPLPVFVSMRLSDSLSDSESYFFAEVRRLHDIMTQLDQQVSFVLLDEILRGTNSDDKRFGTIAVLKKMVAKRAIGAIATHDIEVCNTTADFPEDLMNKCFEVDISGHELSFDYRLRDGVCQNKSASFLMEKMGII